MIEAPEHGWTSALTLTTLLGGILGVVCFVVWELRRDAPMLDPRNFLRRGFGAGSLSISVQFFAAFGFLFLALPYLQLVLGYSPLHAAASLLPMAVVVIPLSRFAPQIAARFGVRVTGPIGLGLMATGFIVFATQLDTGSSYWQFLAGLHPLRRRHGALGRPCHDRDRRLPTAREARGRLRRQRRLTRTRRRTRHRRPRQHPQHRLPDGDPAAHRRSPCPARRQCARLPRRSPGDRPPARIQRPRHPGELAFVHGVTLALLAGAATLVAGAIFVALRAPGRLESQANAGTKPVGTPSPARAS